MSQGRHIHLLFIGKKEPPRSTRSAVTCNRHGYLSPSGEIGDTSSRAGGRDPPIMDK